MSSSATGRNTANSSGLSQFQQFHQAALQNAQNPNHNEVMSFDPVDGREIKGGGRGRSRDASNSRMRGLMNQSQTNQQFNSNGGAQGGDIRNTFNSSLSQQSTVNSQGPFALPQNLNLQNMDITEISTMNLR
mmetsp:Transcript_33553/g.51594  ORF Transcript_33553/g.51594 Transcript_33553/m.51594 type:complete len:132 (-) Transcript_33553:2134-2529(-)